MLDHIAVIYHENRIMFLLMAATNVLLGTILSKGAALRGSRRVLEAMGTRKPAASIYRRCTMLVGQSLAACEKGSGKGAYTKGQGQNEKNGYRGARSCHTSS